MRTGSLMRRVTPELFAATVAASSLAMSGTASASAKDGWLTAGELGLFCNSNQGSSVLDIAAYGSDSNLGNDYFKGSLSCAGQKVDNNVASYWNRTTNNSLLVYTGTNFTGSFGYLPAGYKGNASSTFKNRISSVSTADLE
ncbi:MULTISPECIES: peptidase inhibitor family I36 protein [unclassified Streptomyces]|uniref:peptidase inhibitor family I36 protein n=1 Tax=unclassified Streptomyces TaxID=2593676 RepID=UPI0013141F02|nr:MULTISPECIES: peptidase inhibitor family I36 protein [unclassified Streptomyces]